MLNQDFKDMLSALSAANAEYLVVGAYALAAHGCPRSTGDLDIWVRSTPENARRVWKALESFGAPLSRLQVDDLATPDIVVQIGLAPRRIDILTSITGVTFEDAWSGKLVSTFDGLTIPFLGRSALLTNKKATGRAKDLADVEALEENDSPP